MTLSEAIRLGAMSVPAKRGVLITRDATGQPVAACALGAALVAAGFPRCRKRANELFPILDCFALEPSRGWFLDLMVWRRGATVYHHVVCLFESRGWSRERIADWVETIEREIESASAVDAVDPVEREARSDLRRLTTRA